MLTMTASRKSASQSRRLSICFAVTRVLLPKPQALLHNGLRLNPVVYPYSSVSRPRTYSSTPNARGTVRRSLLVCFSALHLLIDSKRPGHFQSPGSTERSCDTIDVCSYVECRVSSVVCRVSCVECRVESDVCCVSNAVLCMPFLFHISRSMLYNVVTFTT